MTGTAKDGYDYSTTYYSLRDAVHYSSQGERIRISKIVSMAGSGNKILDVGCFDGTIGKILIDRGNEVWGIDASEEAVKLAKEKGVEATVGNLEETFDFEDNFFDACIAAEVIEHIMDTDFFMKEIKRILKPGGSLILSTPNVASLGRRLMLLFGKNPYFEASFGFPSYATAGHIRFFTKNLLISFLEFEEFRVTDFSSDIVNFSGNGRLFSKKLAYIFPTLGKSLIVKARNDQKHGKLQRG